MSAPGGLAAIASVAATRERLLDGYEGSAIIEFGKHAGRTYRNLWCTDQSYVCWVASLDVASLRGRPMKRLSGWCRMMRQADQEWKTIEADRYASERKDRFEAVTQQIMEEFQADQAKKLRMSTANGQLLDMQGDILDLVAVRLLSLIHI